MKDISPSKQHLYATLYDKRFYIDFYQREYVWTDNEVITLLDDIFYIFSKVYEKNYNKELTENVITNFDWYYLNTIITNEVNGKTYIIDGQQRLTTLTLIAVKLYNILKNIENLSALFNKIRTCIYTYTMAGNQEYNIDHIKRQNAMDFILGIENIENNLLNNTEVNIINRYNTINNYFDKKNLDNKSLLFFGTFFLYRLVLVELNVAQIDTPMIFEVINDRGRSLQPYEILKGKLLGVLDKDDIEEYNQKWESSLALITKKENAFFTNFIKSQYIFTRNSKLEQAINNQFHRLLFDESQDIANNFGFLRTNPNHIEHIKNFISNTLVYYTKLYSNIINSTNEFIIYNKDYNQIYGQLQNIMSACCINDAQEKEKIDIISKEIDRLYVLLNLNRVYDSNEFQEISYNLNKLLANKSINEYREVFNNILINKISEKIYGLYKNNVSLLDYNVFCQNGYNINKIRFLRYFFARIEYFICKNTNQQMQYHMNDIITKTSDTKGFHIEHILSNNDMNVQYFENEEEFTRYRNQLGGLLILNKRTNLSSNNEYYSDKLKTYSSGLVLGKTLCRDFYHSNKDFNDFNNNLYNTIGIKFEPIDIFDKNALFKRNQLLWHITKLIWEVD